MLTGIRRYLVESWSELKKVAWPTRETVIRLTILVVAVSIGFSILSFYLLGDVLRVPLPRGPGGW